MIDLQQFRRTAAGDQLRSTYDMLSRDPNSLANLDQDLPNYLQHQVKIHSLPQVDYPFLPFPFPSLPFLCIFCLLSYFSQEWLWCETWCPEETKTTAKTIDLVCSSSSPSFSLLLLLLSLFIHFAVLTLFIFLFVLFISVQQPSHESK